MKKAIFTVKITWTLENIKSLTLTLQNWNEITTVQNVENLAYLIRSGNKSAKLNISF